MSNTATVETMALAFFNANPDEELSLADAVVKFGASRTQTSRVLNELVGSGALKATRRHQASKLIKVYERAQ